MRYFVAFINSLITISLSAQEVYTGLEIPDSITYSKMNFAALPPVSFGIGLDTYILDGFPPVKSQGEIGSCATWSTVYYLEGYYNKMKNKFSSYYNADSLDKSKIFNPLYVHNQVKKCSDDCAKCGTSNYSALEFLSTTGTVTFSDFPIDPENNPKGCTIDPSPDLKNVAKNYKFTNYSIIVNGKYVKYKSGEKYNEIKSAILNGFPVIIGMPVDNNFKNSYRIKNYLWNEFKGSITKSEHHSMICIGFSDSLDAIRIINSWSKAWGDSGYAWISSKLLDKYLTEAYIVNVPGTFLISNKAALTASYRSQSGNVLTSIGDDTTKPPLNQSVFEINTPITRFFITNRYQQFDNIRIIPIEISEEFGIVKFYKKDGDDFKLIDIVKLKLNEIYEFNVEDRRFRFNIYDIRPWRFLGSKALFFKITQIK